MKKQTNLLIRTNHILALAMASWLPIAATAAEEPIKPMKGGGHEMMQDCKAMKEKKEKMMAAMKEQDAKLAEKVTEMNSAPEEKKTDLMATIVTQMVEQRSAMNASKAKMQEKMMMHMMEHMQMGKDSMGQCPMMKGMDKKTATAHKEDQAKMTDTHKAHQAEQK